ncbi:MAG: ethylbenzene dehydrogenase-related protein [Halopseudomonas sp.]
MSEQKRKRLLSAVAVCLSVVLAGASLPAAAIDWSGVKETEVRMFYPGETSMEWIYSKRNHDGAAKYKNRKKTCRGCHDGDEYKYGTKAVKGSDTESKPLVGRRGYLEATVQAAYDGSDFYVRVKWPKTAEAINWPKFTDSLEGVKAEKHDTRLTLMLDDNSIEEFGVGGCWAVCHADERQMSMGGNKEKYLAESRKKMHRKRGGGDNVLSDAEILALINKGVFLEYWQAMLDPGKPAEVADGFILKERVENPNTTVSVTAEELGNDWVVEFKRPLTSSQNHKALESGKIYTFGIALHDQQTAGRYHLASLELKLALGQGDADIIAAKQ